MKYTRTQAYIFLVLASLLAPLALAAYYGLLQTLWLPLVLTLFLLVFPPFAVTGGKSMLMGLFDLELSPNDDPKRKYPWQGRYPWRLFIVTLAAFAVAGEAYGTACWALLDGPQRITRCCHPRVFDCPFFHPTGEWLLWVPAMLCALTLFVVVVAIWVCAAQNLQRFKRRLLGRMICFVVFAQAIGFVVAWAALRFVPVKLLPAILASCLFYVALGIYGYYFLGKRPMVPALASLLMVVLMLGWVGTAAEVLLLVPWHTPLILLIVLGAAVNAWFRGADHAYAMIGRSSVKVPDPGVVLHARQGNCAIVVASAGGGIQSAAWTAKVLEGLSKELGEPFEKSLCLISTVSGGSLGGACYVNWLKKRNAVRSPSAAASASSLDEVAWGLAWPDLLRLLFPLLFSFRWLLGSWLDRAEAMEKAWQGNAALLDQKPDQLGEALSDWNGDVTGGGLPALIMNATMVEAGSPLLLGTSDVNAITGRPSHGWMDGDKLHVNRDGVAMDVPVVRGARLSATFPYVSPVARPAEAKESPHIIDGGFYDNFGMATLTEWLDQALAVDQKTDKKVKKVLVVQIDGFPDTSEKPPRISVDTRGGWFMQLVAPLNTLMKVRTFGQASHRDIELNLLQERWKGKVSIEAVKFDFNPISDTVAPKPAAHLLARMIVATKKMLVGEEEVGEMPQPPLSWHLMATDIATIANIWECARIKEKRAKVGEFLAQCQGQ